MSEFWIKYVLRVAHIGSMIGLCHKTISDYFSGSLSLDHASTYAVLGVVCMASGFINTYILKPKKMGEKRKLWIGYHHLKLLITFILYTPLGKAMFSETALVNARMYWMLSIILVSPFMRFYRQKYSAAYVEKI